MVFSLLSKRFSDPPPLLAAATPKAFGASRSKSVGASCPRPAVVLFVVPLAVVLLVVSH